MELKFTTNDIIVFYITSLYLNMNNIAWLYYNMMEVFA